MELENVTEAATAALSKKSHRNLDFRSNSPTSSDIQIASAPQEQSRPTTAIFTIEEDEISNNIEKPDRNIRQSRRHSCPRKLSQRGRNRIRFSSFDSSSSNTTSKNQDFSAQLQPCNCEILYQLNVETEL